MLTLTVVFIAVFKRSVSETIPDCGKFAQFGGKHIEEVNIDNMAAVVAYEKQRQ